MTNPQQENAVGEIVAHSSQSRHFHIRLATGAEIVAVLPNRPKKFGCLFGSLVGWRVRVVLRPAPKMARIVELVRPNSTTPS